MGLLFAFVIEGFHFLITIYLTKNIKFKNKVLDKLKPMFFFFIILFIFYLVFSGFYVVKTNENIALTTFTGEKKVISDIGIKYSFLSKTETVDIRKQIIKFPSSYEDNGYEIITSDEKPILINSFLEYKIKDVYKWSIVNKGSEQKLVVLFSSNVKSIIQKSNYDHVRNNLDVLGEEIKKDLLDSEDTYGIEILKIILQTSDTISVKHAKSEAESQKIKSEAEKEAYISEAESLKTKYSSLEDTEFIKYIEFLKSIKEGDIEVIIIPQDYNHLALETSKK